MYSEERIRENCRKLKQAFGSRFEKFWPLYAVKANFNPHVLKIVIDEGFELDCSSGSEAWLAKKLDAKGMFTGNYNPPEELKEAMDAGLIINLDDVSQVRILKKIGVPKTLFFA